MHRFVGVLLPLSITGCASFFVSCTERAEIHETWLQVFSDIRSVQVETKNGGVAVRCSPERTSTHIEITRFARGSTMEEAEKHASMVELEIGRSDETPDRLLVVAHVPDELRRYSAGASFEISMPPRIDVDVGTSNGAVTVEGAQGDVDITTSNGAVEIRQVQGDVSATTKNGRVVAADVTGDVVLETSNGAMELERIEGTSLKAKTSNGRITATDLSCAPTLRTKNGAIRLVSASLPDMPQVEAVTSNGSVYLEIPASVKADLSLQTSSGHIDKHLGALTLSNVSQSKRSFEATLNGGGGRIDVETSNGSITFRTR